MSQVMRDTIQKRGCHLWVAFHRLLSIGEHGGQDGDHLPVRAATIHNQPAPENGGTKQLD
jgi:hypothetical protein